MVYHHRLTVLVDHLTGIGGVVLPVAEPVLKLRSADKVMELRRQVGLLAVGSKQRLLLISTFLCCLVGHHKDAKAGSRIEVLKTFDDAIDSFAVPVNLQASLVVDSHRWCAAYLS